DGNPANGLEERLYVEQEANWDVTALVNASGTVVERYDYDPFGQVTYLTASWTTQMSSAYLMVYLHQGGRYAVSTGLYYFRNRDDSPVLGRWTRPDSAGYVDGPNLYEYEKNQPVGATDPLGLAWTKDQLLDNVMKCPESARLWESAKKVNHGND